MNTPSLIFGLLLGLFIGLFLGVWLAEADMREQAITRKLAHWELVGIQAEQYSSGTRNKRLTVHP